MSKIAVIASNGMAGRHIVAELVARGHEVTGFARGEINQSQAQSYVQKDLFDLTKVDLAGFDAVVDAFGTFSPETLHLHEKVVAFLADLLAGSETKLLIVGGAGSLYVNDDHSLQLFETPDFPAEFYDLAKAQAGALALIRQRQDVKWTFVSPAAEFEVDLPITGEYLLAGEVFTLNDKGQSAISYADYAKGFVAILESGQHLQERVSLLGR
ncbi:NAD(P)-dependent oxidoreductase [Streptococcus cuniculipharyngis]|uniref:NAD-dependent epimerase/dehydratase family protein n=1 Tax=Streptococcus cuniculipharyngis TaxID=1562651 RepID=A0A5C5SDD8_9STRE|nr:NAD(P)H-binding protein [Streptococcus cuniculipharyngis]TWS98190.1 NAD-dependent epimerase/dehydratase family protein [Streptococcus cuniculipharyngis]